MIYYAFLELSGKLSGLDSADLDSADLCGTEARSGAVPDRPSI